MPVQKHKVAISYTTRLFADGLKSLLNDLEHIEFTFKVPLGTELFSNLAKDSHDQILILELNCPSNKDVDLIRELAASFPQTKIILLSLSPRNNIGTALLESGVSGYLLKACGREDLISALNKIIIGKPFFCSDITKNLFSGRNNHPNARDYLLTEREKEILSLLVNSHTNKQIADKLHLSENTVKTHRRNILSKFGVSNLIGLVRFACRSNLIDFGDDGYCTVCPYVN